MTGPIGVRTVFSALLCACALTGSASLAQAQQWDQWDGPRRPPAASPYDDRYGEQRDDERYFDQQDGPRADNRYSDPNDDPRRYDPRYNADRDDGSSSEAAPYPGPRVDRNDRDDDTRYSDRNYRDEPSYSGPRYGGRDDDGYGAWDAAPSREEEERLSKSQGSDGGQRPYIRAEAPPRIAFSGPYAPGSIVIDTSARKLYYVLSTSEAYAYPIGVGRQGFAWTGKEKVSRIADWPDWYPPADMRQRKPGLPVRMLGGIRNPLGAKAIYLGNTLYRIHGTNEPKSIGKAESSGCFRMLNENVLHLASLVHVGTEVTIVRSLGGRVASAAKPSRGETKSASAPAPRSPGRHPADSSDDYFDPYNGWH